jgi:hypothetical protein
VVFRQLKPPRVGYAMAMGHGMFHTWKDVDVSAAGTFESGAFLRSVNFVLRKEKDEVVSDKY